MRHLAAGVLGGKIAPPSPLAAGLEQNLEWDGKDDERQPAKGGPFSARVRAGMGVKLEQIAGGNPYMFYLGSHGDHNRWGITGVEVKPDGKVYVSGHSSMLGSVAIRQYDADGKSFYFSGVYGATRKGEPAGGAWTDGQVWKVDLATRKVTPLFKLDHPGIKELMGAGRRAVSPKLIGGIMSYAALHGVAADKDGHVFVAESRRGEPVERRAAAVHRQLLRSATTPTNGGEWLRAFARRNSALREVLSARFRVHTHLYRNALRRSGVSPASATFRDSCEIATVAGDGAECFATACIRSCDNNRHHMRYDEDLAAGYPEAAPSGGP